MRTLKPQVAKVSTVRVEKTFALALSEPNYLILVLHSSKLRFIESECDLKMKALFNTHHGRYSGRLCFLCGLCFSVALGLALMWYCNIESVYTVPCNTVTVYTVPM